VKTPLYTITSRSTLSSSGLFFKTNCTEAMKLLIYYNTVNIYSVDLDKNIPLEMDTAKLLYMHSIYSFFSWADGLDDRVSIPSRDFSLRRCVQTGSGAHPLSYPMGTGGGSFPGGKRDVA
jgi:hypothetical protein